MKIYGVTLTALPLQDRVTLREELDSCSFMVDNAFGKSGALSAVVVYWDGIAPFPGIVDIPPSCPWLELAADSVIDFCASFLS